MRKGAYAVPSATADPTTGTIGAGALYYNSSTSKLRVYSGSAWADVDAGGGGAVTSVAGRTGAVTLTAADIAAGTFPTGSYVFNSGDVTFKGTGNQIVLTDTNVGAVTPNKFIRAQSGALEFINSAANQTLMSLSNTGVLNVITQVQENSQRVYSPNNTPPYPVTSVAGQTGAVTLDAADIGVGTFPGAGTYLFGNTASAVVIYGQQVTRTTYQNPSGTGAINLSNTNAATVTNVDQAPGGIVFDGRGWFGGASSIYTASIKASAYGATGGSRLDIAGTTLVVVAGQLQEGANRVYSAGNAPPYPVTSVATRTGAVTLTAADVGAGTFPGANSYSGLQTFNAGITIPSGQPMTIGTRSVFTGNRAITTNATDTVHIGTFATTVGAMELRFHLHLASATVSVTKVYEMALSSSLGTSGTWYVVYPADASANAASTNDFALEAKRNSATTFEFRIRQKSMVATATVFFTVEALGDTAVTFTPATTITAAPAAVTTMHPSNPHVEAAGNVGIGTEAPTSLLHVNGALAATSATVGGSAVLTSASLPLTQANSHASPDTDSGTTSLHHTIGTGANQSAAGNHSHTLIADGGRITTGFTGQAGWGTFTASYRVIGAICHVQVTCTRSGAGITAGAAGDIVDSDVVIVPAAAQPSVQQWGAYGKGGAAGGIFSISTGGMVTLRSLNGTASIATSDTIALTIAYMLA